MIRSFRLDKKKATAIVGEWLEGRPALATALGQECRDGEAWRLRWPIKAAMDENGLVMLLLQAPTGAWILAWHGPAHFVELVERSELN